MFSISSILTSLTVSDGPIVILVNNLVNVVYVQKVTRIVVHLVGGVPRLRPVTCVLVLFITVGLFLSVPTVSVRVPSDTFKVFILTIFIVAVVIRLMQHGGRKRTASGGR